MLRVNLHEAKARLSALARRVKAGETIVLCERNKPFAEIRPLPGVAKARKRKLGLMKGMAELGPEFWEADQEIARLFNEGDAITPPTASRELSP